MTGGMKYGSSGDDGTQNVTIFDPITQTWSVGDRMARARWYPTNVQMPDGTTLVLTGQQSDGHIQRTMESYDPAAGTWTTLPPSANRVSDLYAKMVVLPDGRVFRAGPQDDTRMFDPFTDSWSFVSQMNYGYRSEGADFMVPVPSCSSFGELNARLEAACTADLDRRVRGKPVTKAELLEVDRAAMLPIPAASFEARRVVAARANSLSLVRFDRNDYSVPTAFAHHELTVIGGIEQVRIVEGARLVARHPRSWEKEQTTFDPVHYLALLERKPGAFDVARPLEHWELPGCFALLRRRLESGLGHLGTREFIKVLRLLEHASVGELASAVRTALEIGATSSDAISLILFHRQERPVSLFSLDRLPHLRPYSIDPPDLSAYASLEGASA